MAYTPEHTYTSTDSIVNDEGKVFDGIEIKDTYIFPNSSGHITIKQSNGLHDEDVIVIIPLFEVENVIRSLRNAKKDLVG